MHLFPNSNWECLTTTTNQGAENEPRKWARADYAMRLQNEWDACKVVASVYGMYLPTTYTIH